MSEPTQELIVSELRRRVRVSIAELIQVLGVQFASLLPQEIQRMKDSGLVVYEEPLGPSSVLSLPQRLLPTCPLRTTRTMSRYGTVRSETANCKLQLWVGWDIIVF
jgi:hypothetical protein